MALFDKLLGRDGKTNEDKFVELTDEHLEANSTSNTQTEIYLAGIDGKRTVMDIKDKLYGGNIIFADPQPLEHSNLNKKRIIDELEKVVNEIGGDIAKNENGWLIITPKNISISRQKL